MSESDSEAKQQVVESMSEHDARHVVEAVIYALRKIPRESLPQNFAQAVSVYISWLLRNVDSYQRALSRYLSEGLSVAEAIEYSEDHGTSPQEAMFALNELLKGEFLDINENVGAKDFMRQQAVAEIVSALEHRGKEKALVLAEQYEKNGVLDLNEDALLFDELTK